MGAWTFVEPYLEWVLGQAGSKSKRAALCRAPGLGGDRDRPDVEASGAAQAFVDEALGSQPPTGGACAPKCPQPDDAARPRSADLDGAKGDMATEIRVPTLGESVTEATVGKWFKKPGDAVKADEPLVELETDKVTLEVNAPAAGVLGEIVAKAGETVGVGAVLGSIEAGGGAPRSAGRREAADGRRRRKPDAAPARRRRGRAPAEHAASPAAAKIAADKGLDPADDRGLAASAASVSEGRRAGGDAQAPAAAAPRPAPRSPPAAVQRRASPSPADDAAREERVRMTQAAPDHRAPPQGRAEHRRHADDLQRGRHERGHGAAQPVQGRCSRRSTA